MAQEKILFNSKEIKQPQEQMGYSFETTYADDSTRTQDGVGHFTPIFTVESFSYEAVNLTIAEMSEILQIIAKGKYFTMHYFSPYYGKWRNDSFYVGKGSLVVGTLRVDEEIYDSLSFNIVGVNPI